MIILIITTIVVFVVNLFFVIKLEREAGYYECGKCHYKYILDISLFWFSVHIGRTRYLECPKCGKKVGIKRLY